MSRLGSGLYGCRLRAIRRALLMARVKLAMDAQKMDVALKLLDAVIKLRPDYVEAWNRRATVYYCKMITPVRWRTSNRY